MREHLNAPGTTALVETPTIGILRPKQRAWIADSAKVKIADKGRRTGFTFGEAADDVLIAAADRAAGGQCVYYIGPTKEMAEEYIDACARWAVGLNMAASAIGEDLLREVDDQGNSREIKTYRIDFPSGFFILALSSRPRSLRGRQGVVVIDEAAFQDDLPGLLKAAMALIILGGKVRIISTHDGAENFFNELLEDCRARRRSFSVHRCTFQDAVDEGLYRSLCEARHQAWTEEGERAFVAEVREFYKDNVEEELDCIPSLGGGTYLPLTLILPCVRADIPVVRFDFDDAFLNRPSADRNAEVLAMCREQLAPLIAKMDREAPTYFGGDFGRSANRTTVWPAQKMRDTRLRTPFVLELYNCPFEQHETIFIWLIDRLPNFAHGKQDARGNGAALAEKLRTRYGAERIEEVKATREWYVLHWPIAKGRLEDRTADVPADREVQDDLRAVKVVKSVPTIPESQAGADKKKGKRHGDAAIAFVNLCAAAIAEPFSVAYETPASRPGDLYDPRPRDPELRMQAGDDDDFNRPRERATW